MESTRVEIREDGVAIIHMINGQNKWNKDYLRGMKKALDEVESNQDVKSLVITGEGKFFSFGLDLPWISDLTDDGHDAFFQGAFELILRVTNFPMPTTAAINGHAYGAGAFLVLACDYRVMRKDRGWFCLPETNLGISFLESQLEQVRGKLPSKRIARDAALFSKRYTGEEALKAGIVDELVDQAMVLDTAVRYGQEVAGEGLNRDAVKATKEKLYGNAIAEKHLKDLAAFKSRREAKSNLSTSKL